MQAPPFGFTTFSSDSPQDKTAEFNIGIGSQPYLADHGFADLIVLPGSFYIQLALQVHREIFNETARTLQNIRFQSPLILTDQDSVIKVNASEKNSNRVDYVFLGPISGDGGEVARPLVELGIDRQSLCLSEGSRVVFSPNEFKAHAELIADGRTFYEKLRQNGNQYGPHFQNVSEVWRSGSDVLGKIAIPSDLSKTERSALHPIIIDSITQLLGTFTLERGATYILKSIDRIEISEHDFADILWSRATRRVGSNGDAKELTGDIDVFDESGTHCMQITGAVFAYLDRPGAIANAGDELELCLASTFTSEPIEDTIEFWGDHFDFAPRVQFAPYNQIFQQLLGNRSVFRENNDGVNAILLSLEDWTGKDQPVGLQPDSERLEKCFGGRSRYTLPNGLEIVHLHQYETDYLYREIFRDQCYLRHGIAVHEGDTVIDIGANIGLFSLFILNRCPSARIYSYEPSPVVYELLKANCEAYGSNVHCFQFGVSDRTKTAAFTFYENSSVFSSFYSDTNEDREAVSAIVRNVLSSDASGESREAFVNELTAERLRQRTYQCRLISVSDIIRQNRIDKVHLLKIDAEKSELEILRGIADEHWPLIDQLVVEIHDLTKLAVKKVEQLLTEKGFRCTVEQEKLLENSGLFNVYARRLEVSEESAMAINSAQKVSSVLESSVDEFCEALDAFMSGSTAPMILCVCPRSPEVSKQIFDAAEQTLSSRANRIANVHFISSQLLTTRYPLSDYHDPHSHGLGHVPFTLEGYAAIGTTLIRTILSLRRSPLKVIVIDCDNTLWQGVCGEDGPTGVRLTEAHRLLQQFLVDESRVGLLLCVCSKNNEKDVFEVFDQQREMVLKREHLVAWRINWNRKSDNIKALAEELNLGLESFLFIDDEPVECAYVRINCPEVLTLQLPTETKEIASFLKGIWGLEGTVSTQEDQKRTGMYQENVQREEFRERTVSLKDFLNGLQLRIHVDAPTESQIARVSQLTIRTNQFNFTSIRRTENEIRGWLEKENHECLIASVSDRFGDYGLVGILLYEIEPDRLRIDTFLLSCRVLGRGVEHFLLSELGRKAEEKGKSFVELHYVPTERNSPALEFIESLPADDREKDKTGVRTIKFRTETLLDLRYEPDQKSFAAGSRNKVERESGNPARSRFDHFNRSEKFQKIANELADISRIAKAVEDFRYGDKTADVSDGIGPANTLEKNISNMWMRVLARRNIAMNDNFFEVGGTSLRAVQLIALMQKELKRSFSITTLFECPTINLLAAKLKKTAEGDGSRTDATKAQMRGQQRRTRSVTRKTAAR